jgi:DNA-directed RNA polymerase specialized sigma24 family protein
MPEDQGDDDSGSITSWINRLKSGDHDAVQKLWERYFSQLVRLARARLVTLRKRGAEADEEDAALSAFDSFCNGAARGRFPQLKDRDGLWRLLVIITSRKVSDQVVRHGRKKRGAGQVISEAALIGSASAPGVGLDGMVGHGPTPEFAAMMAEEFRNLLDVLGDDTIRRIAIWRLEGYTKDEIAQRLDCSPRTVAYKLEFIRKTWLTREVR